MAGLSALDAAVIVGYFLAIVSFGALFGRFTRSTRDFFLAGQRLPAWLIAFSCIATVVGSYSFVKYSAAGYQYGVASSQTYFNDWFWMPLFLFGWLPILYYSRILSVPEYFHRRFDRRTGIAATAVLLLYLVGYIGINLFTIGKALESLFGIDLFVMALVVTALCMVYEWTGGQTSVIYTDLFQGALLLAAGLLIAVLGLSYLGGIDIFARLLPEGHLRPLPEFNTSSRFNFVGIFWQDGLAGGVAFYFMNQGMLMRFLSARSVGSARRGAALVLIVLMPLAAIAVSGAGWIGSALETRGDLPAATSPDDVFVRVTNLLTVPGVFGVVMAALLAALMSTADTLINASSALLVNDIYRPLLRRGKSEKHYLAAARWTSLLAAAAGLSLVPLYSSFGTIYEAHGAFTAAITPPMAVTLLLAFLWPRFTPAAALATLLGGTALMFLSIPFPELVTPFAHGIPDDGGYKYIRACYGVAISAALAFGVTWMTRPRAAAGIEGLTVWSLDVVRRRFSGGRGDRAPRVKQRCGVRALDERERARVIEAVGNALAAEEHPALVGPALAQALELRTGELIFVDDARWWLGGLRSARCRVAIAPVGAASQDVGGSPAPARAAVRQAGGGRDTAETIGLPREVLERNSWSEGQPVVLEVID